MATVASAAGQSRMGVSEAALGRVCVNVCVCACVCEEVATCPHPRASCTRPDGVRGPASRAHALAVTPTPWLSAIWLRLEQRAWAWAWAWAADADGRSRCSAGRAALLSTSTMQREGGGPSLRQSGRHLAAVAAAQHKQRANASAVHSSV